MPSAARAPPRLVGRGISVEAPRCLVEVEGGRDFFLDGNLLVSRAALAYCTVLMT